MPVTSHHPRAAAFRVWSTAAVLGLLAAAVAVATLAAVRTWPSGDLPSLLGRTALAASGALATCWLGRTATDLLLLARDLRRGAPSRLAVAGRDRRLRLAAALLGVGTATATSPAQAAPRPAPVAAAAALEAATTVVPDLAGADALRAPTDRAPVQPDLLPEPPSPTEGGPDVGARPRPATHRTPGRPRPDEVVVLRGDTLWALAAAHLPPHSSDAEIAAACHAWHLANRETIGPDPDLLLPGQVLHVPAFERAGSLR
ncbi:LysM peptidoglycan-binding domain-containing protein [Arsenicicoccus dermatophilus]|uniref:LysM peptidoglycan-binding domain-containing protein n=1 Tax=Arsenicicoccus dermatophilus TaxID=1076331 RepID=UPI003916F9D8